MIKEVTFWAQILATALDALLLARILTLRLQRTYTFITLAAVLVLLFDLADLIFGSSGHNDAQGSERAAITLRLFLYSRFVWVVLYPAVAWDVFEEIKSRLGRIREIAIGRLISGIFFTMILAFVMLFFISGDDSSGEPVFLGPLAMTLWAGSITASLAFLVTIRRVMRSQVVEMPANTGTWVWFYQLMLGAEILFCFTILLEPLIRTASVNDFISFFFIGFDISVTAWCITKLRRVPVEDPDRASQTAS